jgi:LDH2 family malate/lactate/ureidoglycolate dehydrogenase
MRESINQVRDLMTQALTVRGLSPDDSRFIADDFLEAQAEGHQTHGVGKFLLIDEVLRNRLGEPIEVSRSGGIAVLDGNREVGQLAARRAAELAVELAHSHGVGMVSLRNASRFSRLTPYARAIAASGHAALVTNNAGPAAVTPYGSRTPIMGTNPLAFGFPRGEGAPYVIDFSTAERVWGEIRQAILEERPLPDNAFLDAAGNVTTDPEAVEAVLPFGGHKGAALCIALEMLAGVLAGAAMGQAVTDEYQLGAVFIAMSPPAGLTPASSVDELLTEIRRAAPLNGAGPVHAPGDRSEAARRRAAAEGTIELDANTKSVLMTMSQGGAGLAASWLTN